MIQKMIDGKVNWMSNQISSPTFTVRFPVEQGLSARQLMHRLAAHSDRQVEIRGRFEGGWALWVSLSGHDTLSVTSIVSYHHDFNSALDHISAQIVEKNFFSALNYAIDQEYAG